MPSELGKLFSKALGQHAAQPPVEPVRLYSDIKDLSALWDDRGQTSNPRWTRIVWDGQPDPDPASEGDRLLLPHLTPLDWALTVSLNALEQAAAHVTTVEPLRIEIWDLTFGAHRDTWAGRTASSLLEAMPWVRIYAPLTLGRLGYKPWPTREGLTAPLPGTPSLQGVAQLRGSQPLLARLRALTRAWKATLAEADEHHDVNNLLAPTLLLPPGKPLAASTPAARALNRRIRLRVGPSHSDPVALSHSMTDAVAETLDGVTSRQSIMVRLFDDMAERGWASLVESWLPVDGGHGDPIQFTWSTNPDSVLQILEQASEAAFRQRRYQGPMRAASDDTVADEVLLWDLRLFSTRPSGQQPTQVGSTPLTESAFFEKLLKEIERHGLEEKTVHDPLLAWRPFSTDELQEVRAWLKNPQGPAPEVGLTLAPRCLALLAPTTPIIILSSTSRRSLIERFRDYGNILTGFEKPRPLDTATDWAITLVHQWRSVWLQAANLLHIQQRLRSLQQSHQVPRHPNATPLPVRTEQPEPYVEVYFDETGIHDRNSGAEIGLTVGGVIAIYPGTNGSDVANRFDELLYLAGVRYFDALIPKFKDLTLIAKGTPVAGAIRKGKRKLADEGSTVRLHRFALSFDRSPVSSDEPMRTVGDFRYFQTLATALELVLYEILHHVLGQRFRVSVYVGTRQYSRVEPGWEAARRDFGYDEATRTPGADDLLQTVGGAAVLPVLARVMTERPTVDRFRVHRAMGARLAYENDPRKERPMLANRFVCREANCSDVRQWTPYQVWPELIAKQRAGGPPATPQRKQTTTGVRLLGPYNGSSRCQHDWVPDLRALHFVADEVLTLHRYKRGQYNDPALFEGDLPSFEESDDMQLRDLVLATRLADRNEPVLALIRALTAVGTTKPIDLSPVRQLLLTRLSPVLETLSGPDLLRVAYALPEARGPRPAIPSRAAHAGPARKPPDDSPSRTECVLYVKSNVHRLNAKYRNAEHFALEALGVRCSRTAESHSGNWKLFFVIEQQTAPDWLERIKRAVDDGHIHLPKEKTRALLDGFVQGHRA